MLGNLNDVRNKPPSGSIRFGQKKKYAPVIITDEIARYLRTGGHDPSSLNKITWPLFGASNHAHAKFLIELEEDDAENPFYGKAKDNSPATDRPEPVVVFLHQTLSRMHRGQDGELSFQMYPIEITSVFHSQSHAEDDPETTFYWKRFCIVELVDERYWWKMFPIRDRYEIPGTENEFRDGMFKNGLNFIDRSDRTMFIRETLFPDVSEDDEDPEGLVGPEETMVLRPWNAGLVIQAIIQFTNEKYGHLHGNDEFPFMKNLPIITQSEYFLGSDFTYNPPEAEESESEVVGYDMLDVSAVGRTLAEFIDEVMTSSGLALRCTPAGTLQSIDETEDSNFPTLENSYLGDIVLDDPHRSTYAITSFEKDVMLKNTSSTLDLITEFRILDGQISAAETQQAGMVSGQKLDITGVEATPVPESCVVFFPKSLNNSTSEIDKLVSIDTDFGIPYTTETSGNETTLHEFTLGGNKKTIYGHLHARFSLDEDGNEVWDNEEDCKLYADRLSNRYYGRFRLLRLDIKYHAFYTFYLAAFKNMSIQTVVWHLSEIGPTTHLYASRDNPLLGFRTDLKQSQDDIKASGGGLAYPRNDGSVLIEAGRGTGGTLHHAFIIGWDFDQSPYWNSRYTAICPTDPGLSIHTDIQPIRPHNPNNVRCHPLEMGDPCIIGLVPEYLLKENHDVINGSVGRAMGSPEQILLESDLFGERSFNLGDNNPDPGQYYEYYKTVDGRYVVLYVFEVPKVVNCEFIVPPGADRRTSSGEVITETFYSRSNIYGY